MTASKEPAGEAVPKQIPLSALAEEMAAEAEFHRNRKLLCASRVDELVRIVAEQTRIIETLKKPAKKAGEPDNGAV